jgi:hypothetical protein
MRGGCDGPREIGLVAEFRVDFSGEDDSLIAVAAGGNDEVPGIIYRCMGGGPLPAPSTVPWTEALPGPGAPLEIFNLLSWKCRLCAGLVGRDGERAALLDWARTGAAAAGSLSDGTGRRGQDSAGGGSAAALSGWHAGFVALERAATVPLSRSGLLLVLDYPEAWPAEVASLLREGARMASPPAPIRLLLSSRRGLSDWNDLMVRCGASVHLSDADDGEGTLAAAQNLGSATRCCRRRNIMETRWDRQPARKAADFLATPRPAHESAP